MAAQCEPRVRHQSGAAIIELNGTINGQAEQALGAAYDLATASGPSRIVLAFGGTEYINSTGIALIVGLLARARKEGRPVAAYGLNEHYRELFEITRLADFMRIVGDEAAAVAAHESKTAAENAKV